MPASPSPTRDKHKRVKHLPELFAVETHLLGWQGMTVTVPAEWNLASFSGDEVKGDLRVTDDNDNGLRLELRWELPQKSVDLERSVEQFVEQLARGAKKQGEAFQERPEVRLISKSRKRKAQLTNFGWVGEKGDVMAGQGWGVAWQCADCGRVVVGHVIGRGLERQDKVQRLATEVLSSLECHGNGGWQTWAVFGLQLDVPEEFHLGRARLLTGRLELEWLRRPAPGVFSWTQRLQRIALTRVAPANILLENESLEEWTVRTMARLDKKRRFGTTAPTMVRGHEALLLTGVARDPRVRVRQALLDRIMRRRTPPAELRVWHCAPSNKIFALDCELSCVNEHVTGDVLDSLECHR